ncbi:KR domain-containing protein [Bradyrhizobium japonicum]
MSIIVTGASGSLGLEVVQALLRQVSASDLILVSRSPDKLQGFAARSLGAIRGFFRAGYAAISVRRWPERTNHQHDATRYE